MRVGGLYRWGLLTRDTAVALFACLTIAPRCYRPPARDIRWLASALQMGLLSEGGTYMPRVFVSKPRELASLAVLVLAALASIATSQPGHGVQQS